MSTSEPIIIRVAVEGGEESAVQVDHVARSVGSVDGEARKAEKGLGVFARGLTGVRGALGYALGVGGLGGLAFGLGDAVKKASEFQDRLTQMKGAIRTFRSNVQPASADLSDFADKLSMKGGFDPSSEIEGLTMLLRATHSVGESEKDMGAATDLARGAHVSLTRAVRTLTMAEEGRTTGLTRLGINLIPVTAATDALTARSGTATEAQKRAAQAADYHSTALNAVNAIMRKFAGSTRDYSNTASGSTENLSHALDILGEKVGLALTPYITKAAHAMTGFIRGFEDGTGAGGKFHTILDEVVGDAKAAVAWIGRNKTMLGELAGVLAAGVAAWAAYRLIVLAVAAAQGIWAAVGTVGAIAALIPEISSLRDVWVLLDLAMDANPIGVIVVGLGLLAGAFIVAYNKVGWFRNAVDAAFRFVRGAVTDTVGWVKDHWQLIASILGGPFVALPLFVATHFGQVKTVVAGIINWIIGAVNKVIGVIDSIHVKLPKVLGIGGGTIGFNIAPIANVSFGGSGPSAGSTAISSSASGGHRVAHFALGGYVSGEGHSDSIAARLKPGEYVATDSMVGDVGRSAMDEWRAGGPPPSGADEIGQAVADAIDGLAVYMDGKQVGVVLAQNGRNDKALR